MRRQYLVLVLLGLLLAGEARAQTVLQVPYDRAVIVWDAPQYGPESTPPAMIGVTRWHIINCGGLDIRIDLPARSVPVATVAPTPGTYSCILWAANTYGKSEPTPVPTFEAGDVPANPSNVRIEVR